MGNAASTVPYGAQISQINSVLTLTSPGPALDYQWPTTFSVTGPLSGGSDQQIYFSDAVGAITLPSIYASSATSYGSTQYSATLELDLALTGAAPTQYKIIQTVNKKWNDTNANVLNFPQAGGVLPAIGPFLLGPAGQNADLIIRNLNVSVTFEDDSGASLGTIPALYDADGTGYTPVISSVVVDNSFGPPLVPSNGAPGMFPPLRQNEKTTIVNIPINCTRYSPGTYPENYNLTIGGTGPAVAHAGQPVFLTNWNNFLTIPDDVAGSLTALYGGNGTHVLSVTLGQIPYGRNLGTGLGISLANASPGNTDVAREFTATDRNTANPLVTAYYVPGYDDKAEKFPLPRTGSLTLGPYTPGAAGSQFGVNFTTLNAYIEGIDAYVGESGFTTVQCSPLSPVAFLTAPIVS